MILSQYLFMKMCVDIFKEQC